MNHNLRLMLGVLVGVGALAAAIALSRAGASRPCPRARATAQGGGAIAPGRPRLSQRRRCRAGRALIRCTRLPFAHTRLQ